MKTFSLMFMKDWGIVMQHNVQAPKSITQKTFKIAGYHDSIRDFARILEMSSVPKHIADNAWHEGKRDKEKGLPCSCHSC